MACAAGGKREKRVCGIDGRTWPENLAGKALVDPAVGWGSDDQQHPGTACVPPSLFASRHHVPEVGWISLYSSIAPACSCLGFSVDYLAAGSVTNTASHAMVDQKAPQLVIEPVERPLALMYVGMMRRRPSTQCS